LFRWSGSTYSPEGEKTAGLDRRWLLSQFRGLAGALATIHGPIGPDLITPYHHDVKPVNILMFNSTTTNSKPTFKLADWDCVSWKPQSDPSAGSVGTTRHGTRLTLPPETHEEGSSSRPHDVWSLGCIFLDLAIWHKKGWDNLKNYRSRVKTASLAWCYYRAESEQKVLTRNVATTLYRSRADDLIRIIGEMLEIEPGNRIRAAEREQQLNMVT
jgi:serine/threonine protein kinase